jgi:CubicO group peptidase (beta-lactamase class C family)
MGMEVHGEVAAGFERVVDAFAQNFEELGEVGAAYTLYVGGRAVVDIWGGVRDERSGAPYDAETLQVVFSSTKGAAAACVHLLAQRGEIELDAPVARYWPEFGGSGKEAIPVRWLLSHQAGLATLDARLTRDEALSADAVVRALEAQAPLWEPGRQHGYHAFTFGYLLDELVRRVDGRDLATFFRDEFAGPLGLEFWIGLPEKLEPRVAPVIPMEAASLEGFDLTELLGPDSLLMSAMSLNGAFGDIAELANSRDFRAARLPAANGITNSRSLARFYAGLIGGVEGGPDSALLAREQIDIARAQQTSGADLVLSMPGMAVESTIGVGFYCSSAFAPMGGAGAFGHHGAGGSLGFADPEHGLAGGYVMNKMGLGNIDPRPAALVRASYEAAGVPVVHG